MADNDNTDDIVPLDAVNKKSESHVDAEIASKYSEVKQKLTTTADKKKRKGGKKKKKKKKKKSGEDEDDLKQELDMDQHIVPLEELEKRFNTDFEKGMTSQGAADALIRDGRNILTPPKQVPEILKFLHHIVGGFAMLLWTGSFLCFISYGIDQTQTDNLYLGVVLAVVILITGTFAYYQDHSSAKVMDGFAKMIPKVAIVVRDGEKMEVDASELVLGDVVWVEGGYQIPADLRVIQQEQFKVDNSSLTGESEPQPRSAEMTDENPLETRNLCFFSTYAQEGRAKCVVVQCGDSTVIGRIARLATTTDSGPTPIHIEINHFILIVSVVAVSLGLIFFLFGLSVYPILTNLVFVIGIIVANVPEGLLATVTVSLTLTARRMAEKNVLVKNLESVETLGSTTNICSDKTGTLTLNQMTAAHIWYNNEIHTCDTSVTRGSFNAESEVAKALIRICGVNSKSEFLDGEDVPVNERRVNGDASEAALLKWVENMTSTVEMRERCALQAMIPFNSKNKYMVTVNASGDKDDPRYVVTLKGAPERVLARCKTILVHKEKGDDAIEAEEIELTEEWVASYENAYDTLGGMGERVLGFAHMMLDPKDYPEGFEFDVANEPPNFPIEDMTFVGLVSLIDPPRPTVPEAVRLCQSAGIKVTMVTGDHPKTAKAIAKQVGIITMPTREDIAEEEGVPVEEIDPSRAKAIVIHGSSLVGMPSDDLDAIVINHDEIVFARTSPQQKLLIVEAYQRQNCIVAVTGDGVNDSPALKKADIGVAMGISGSDVAIQVADMILLDDNFASIVKGVEEGRLIFDNLKKSIAYTLSSNIPEIAPFICFIIIRIPLPLSTVLILAVDLGTDLLPAISLAYEQAESDIMRRRPRNAQIDRLVNARLIGFSYLQIGVIQALGGLYTYFVVMGFYGFPPWSLVGVGDIWDNTDKLMRFTNAQGMLQAATFAYRRLALRSAQTAYFVTIVLVQWADLMICKTRKLSIFQQGMKNITLNVGLLEETVLCAMIVYIPGLGTGLGTEPIPFGLWWPGIGFSVLIFSYDEVRKLIIRRYPGGWVEDNTYY